MKYFYFISIKLYGVGIFILSFFDSKAKKWIDGRKKWRKKLLEVPKNTIWFHCASLGEFDQALPLMNEIKRRNPKEIISVSFFSPSGFENFQKRVHPVDFSFYLPLDTTRNSDKFLEILKPKLALFIKYEFWPNFLFACEKHKIPVLSISSIFRNSQIYFKSYAKYFLDSLKKIDHFFVQNEESRELLEVHGIKNITVCGDTRYDNVIQNKELKKDNDVLLKFSKNEFVIIVGSSWKDEEEIILEYLRTDFSSRVIIAPHNINDSNIKRIENLFDELSIRYTNFDNFSNQRILILDNIGHLSFAYKYANIAFVGGGFSGKLHNILEPAVYGLPVLFGPKVHKFPEAELFISKGIAFKIQNFIEFDHQIKFLKQQGDFSAQIKEVFNSNSNVAKKIIDHLIAKKYLSID